MKNYIDGLYSSRLISLSTIIVLAFYATEMDFPSFSGFRPAYAIFSFIILMLLPFCWRAFRRYGGGNLPYGVILSYVGYIIICFAPLVWYDQKFYSSLQISVVILCLIAGFSATGFYTIEVYKSLIVSGFIVIALSWISLVISPEFALQQKMSVQEMGLWRLKGIMTHEMRLANVAVVTLISALYILRNCTNGFPVSRGWVLAILVVSLLTLVATQARAITGYAVVVAAFLLCFRSRLPTRLVVIYMVLACAFALWMVGLDAALSPFSRGEADLTLTGRTMIWERTLAVANERPWLGHGFSSFGSLDYDSMWGRYRPAVAHNVWIDAYFELGIPGVTALAFVHIAMLRAAWRARARPEKISLSFCLVLFAALCGLTGVGIGGRLQAIVGICIFVLSSEYAQSVRSGAKVSLRRRNPGVRRPFGRAVPQSRLGNFSR